MADIGIGEDELNDVLFWSLTGGATAFTPVPGGIRIPILRHLMVVAQLRHGGIQTNIVKEATATVKSVHVLSRGPPMSKIQMAKTAAYYGLCCCALEQIMKKCCLIFTVKDAVEDTTKLLHEGWLLAYALKEGHLTTETMKDNDELWRVRGAILEACDQIDTSPLSKAIMAAFNAAQGRDTMKETASTVTRSMTGHLTDKAFEEALQETEGDTRQELKGLSKQLAGILKSQRPYLQKFEGMYVDALKRIQDAELKPSAGLLCCKA